MRTVHKSVGLSDGRGNYVQIIVGVSKNGNKEETVGSAQEFSLLVVSIQGAPGLDTGVFQQSCGVGCEPSVCEDVSEIAQGEISIFHLSTAVMFRV